MCVILIKYVFDSIKPGSIKGSELKHLALINVVESRLMVPENNADEGVGSVPLVVYLITQFGSEVVNMMLCEFE